MGDLEARVAALEDERRKLLSSWQRERDESVRKDGTWHVLIAEELAALSARSQSMRTELSKTTRALEHAQCTENTSQACRAH